MVVIMGDNGTPDTVLDDAVNDGEAYGSYYINNVITTATQHLKSSLYEGGVKVPLIVSGPMVGGTAGRKIMQPVYIPDLFATFLDATDVSMPIQEGTYYDSHSILGLLSSDKGTTTREEIFIDDTEQNGFFGLTSFDSIERNSVLISRFTVAEYGSHKGTYKMHRDTLAGTIELYMLRDGSDNHVDSYEQSDLSASFSVATDARGAIYSYMASRIQYYIDSNGGANLEPGYDT